jgi:phage protein D
MDSATVTLLIDGLPADSDLIDAYDEIEVECSIEEASAFRARFGITKTEIGDWSILDIDPFRPFTAVSILLQTGSLPPTTLINGYVSEHDIALADDPGVSTLEVSGLDATSLMNVEEKVAAWPNLPDSAIAAEIFAGYELIPIVGATTPRLTDPEGTTIQRGTDIRFLRRLARRNGFDCYVQPQPLTGIDQGFFQSRQLLGLPQAILNVSFGEDTNVSDFRIHYDLTAPAAAQAYGLDADTNQLQPAYAPAGLELPLGLDGTLMRERPAPLLRPADTGLPSAAELQDALQGIVDRSTWAILAEGTVGMDVPILRPGSLVNIRGCGRTHNGSYLVTRVRHLIEPGGYEQRFEARRNAVQMTGTELYVDISP